jgi:hypothetical protein
VDAPGFTVSIFTVDRLFKVNWSNDPQGFLTCFKSICTQFSFEVLMISAISDRLVLQVLFDRLQSAA